MTARRYSLGNLIVAAPAIGASLVKSLLVMAAGWTASSIAGPAIGSLVLLAGSFAIMVPTFRREWRLGWVTCLLPPIAAGISYAVQLALMEGANVSPPEEWILPVLAAGVGIGWFRGRSHQVAARSGSVFAQRTTGYLLLWVFCFAINQVFALARQRDLIEFALLAGAFSTAMLLTVAVVLLRKRGRALATLATTALVALGIWGDSSRLTAQTDLCGLLPQWAGQRFQEAPLNDSRGNPTQLVYCPSHAMDRPVRSLHIARGDSEAIAHTAFETFRSMAEAPTRSVALGDEAWETAIDWRSNLRVWSRMVRVGNYLTVTNAAQEAVAEMTALEAELIRNVRRMGGVGPDDPPPPPVRGTMWTDVLLPLGAVSFLDDFGTDPRSVAAMEATVLASLIMILTCIGLTVSESLSDAVSRISSDPLAERKKFVDSADMLGGPPLIDWDGETVPVQDGTGKYLGGEIGQVWYDGTWMDRVAADRLVRQRTAERRAELATRDRESREFQEESQEVIDESIANQRRENEAEEARVERRRLIEEEQKRRDESDLASIGKRLTRDDMDLDTRLEALDLAADGNLEGLRDLYRAALQEKIESGAAEAAAKLRTARIAGIGEMGAKAVVGYAKAQLAVLGGPMNAPFVLGATGLISGAGEGAESVVAGDSWMRAAAKTLAGFLSGVKDGAASMIANVPGQSVLVKMLVPASADGAETFVRTGDIKQAAMSAGTSIASDMAGGRIDALSPGAAREAARAAMSSSVGGVTSVVAGGSFGDGAMDALAGHIGARAGARHGEIAGSRAELVPDRGNDPGIKSVLEESARKAEGVKTKSPQPKILDELTTTRHEGMVIGPDGSETTKVYVNAKKALEQLADPASSRWLKNGPEELQQAVLNTREDQIYGPANAATINKATPRLEAAGLLEPGDRVVVKGFSTPNKLPSVGADRDARLLIERNRFNRATGKTEVVQIEVDRKHWENDAYKDFYDHTTKIAGPLTPNTEPGFFKRVEELSYLKKSGFSDEQIRHRAWAEHKNQLFTDGRHIDASRDNRDQTIRITKTEHGIEIEPKQITPRVVGAQGGRAKLGDPRGAGDMWVEKPRMYVHHIPSEAIAQSQKGIEALLKTREGYLKQGLQPPPINDTMASAMKIIAAVPVDTPLDKIPLEKLTADLKAIGFKSLDDALVKIGHQHELLSQSRPITFQPGTLSAADMARIARSGVTRPRTGGGN